MRGILDIILDHIGHDDERPKMYGVVPGQVTHVDAEQARVKVKFPWMSDEDTSHWARIAALMAGPDRGTFFMPEKDDEVLCAFEHGDIRFPYVVGFLWNGVDPPPDDRQAMRVIHSKSGHRVELWDEAGTEAVTIRTQGGHTIHLDDTPGVGHVVVQTSGGHEIRMDDTPGVTRVSVATSGGQGLRLVDVPGSPVLDVDATLAGNVTIRCQQATVVAPNGLSVAAPRATFVGVLQAATVQAGTVQAGAIISPAYTPGIGNLFGL